MLVLLAATALLGCAEIISADRIAVNTVADVVETYCKLPELARKVNHAKWKAATAPNEITITCSSR